MSFFLKLRCFPGRNLPPHFCNLLSGCSGHLRVGLDGADFPDGPLARTLRWSPRPSPQRGETGRTAFLLANVVTRRPLPLRSHLFSLSPPPCSCFRPVPCGRANRSWMTPTRTICTWVRLQPWPSATPARAAVPAKARVSSRGSPPPDLPRQGRQLLSRSRGAHSDPTERRE